ncbi:MAG: hypothetical protein ACOC4G_11170 [Bacillota bacterium]
MKVEIGRTKSGKLLRIYDDRQEYYLEVGGELRDSFDSRSKAVRKGKMLMVKSWLPEASEENIAEMLDSYVDFDYNFTLEWCDRQAEKHPECDCGCWGYPLEMGTIWSWRKNKYRGCPKCGEDIGQEKE